MSDENQLPVGTLVVENAELTHVVHVMYDIELVEVCPVRPSVIEPDLNNSSVRSSRREAELLVVLKTLFLVIAFLITILVLSLLQMN
jgi:hypothetical protein